MSDRNAKDQYADELEDKVRTLRAEIARFKGEIAVLERLVPTGRCLSCRVYAGCEATDIQNKERMYIKSDCMARLKEHARKEVAQGESCSQCGGSGRVTCDWSASEGTIWKTCPVCNGAGKGNRQARKELEPK